MWEALHLIHSTTETDNNCNKIKCSLPAAEMPLTPVWEEQLYNVSVTQTHTGRLHMCSLLSSVVDIRVSTLGFWTWQEGSTTSSGTGRGLWARGKEAVDRGRTTLLIPERQAEPSGAFCGVQLESQMAGIHCMLTTCISCTHSVTPLGFLSPKRNLW